MSRPALSATRATDLLNFLAAHPGEAFTYSQLAECLQINLASTHNLLTALTECGYLTRDPESKAYELGPVLVAIGAAALERNPVIDAARGRMRKLSRELGLETLAFVLAGSDTLCVARAGPESPGGTARVGQRLPLIAPLASVFVAWAPELAVSQWIERGGFEAREQSQLLDILEVVRARGYSVALEVEGRRQIVELLAEQMNDPRSAALRRELRAQIAELGHGAYQFEASGRRSYRISTVTAPVLDDASQVVLSISVQGFERALSARQIAELGNKLLVQTRALAKQTRMVIRR
jgi:DNA-binding IclR family transcriptional regulator